MTSAGEVRNRRRGVKWRRHDPALLPAWVADMDLPACPEVLAAGRRFFDDDDLGYYERIGEDSVAAAFAEWSGRRHGWSPDPSRIELCCEVVQGIQACLLAFGDRDDGVVVNPPVYPPFHRSVGSTGRRLVSHPLVDTSDGFRLPDDLAVDPGTRIVLWCHPHNPTGRSWSRAELERVAAMALDHDLVILSDEIHADLVHPGATHVPMASLGADVAARTVTLTSASKAFNLAAIGCAVLHFGSPALHERFTAAFPSHLLGRPSGPAVDATIAAWRHGDRWLDATMTTLTANRDRAVERLRAVPGICVHRPEATYLLWLDCSGLDLDRPAAAFLADEAGVVLNAGETFGDGYESWARLNVATYPEILDEIIDRIVSATTA